jgi:hypothetical protein
MNDRPAYPTLLEAWDGIQVFLTGPVVAAGALPGMLICAPGIIFLVVFPLVLAGILLVLFAITLALVAAPFLIVRAMLLAYRRRTPRRSARGARLVARRST